MNAQEYWKFLYRDRHSINYAWFLSKRRETRREAALERIVARQQREIEALKADLELAGRDLLDSGALWI